MLRMDLVVNHTSDEVSLPQVTLALLYRNPLGLQF
jgi:hypothetical protein